MDAVKAVKDYVTKMINAEGMKVMLLDEETVRVCPCWRWSGSIIRLARRLGVNERFPTIVHRHIPFPRSDHEHARSHVCIAASVRGLVASGMPCYVRRACS